MNDRFAEGDLFYFWKGRVGLFALLKAAGLVPGDEVVVPGFTCIVVPNAVLYARGVPVYADIDPRTFNVTVETIEPLLSARTRAVIVQSTFGLSADLDPIMALAERRGLLVIEDCAHALGGEYRGRPNGTIAHAAFFSSQWSKPVSTGLGGIVFSRRADLSRELARRVESMAVPGFLEQVSLTAQLICRPLADSRLLHYPLVETYRWLTQVSGLVSVGSASHEELVSVQIPSAFEKRMSAMQRRRWHRGLQDLPDVIRRRRATAARYDEYLAGTSIQAPARPDYATHAMLRYAIRVPDRESVERRARERRVPLGDWFRSPLHPNTGDLNPWHYRWGQCPVAERVCTEIVNLYTDRRLSDRQLQTLLGAYET